MTQQLLAVLLPVVLLAVTPAPSYPQASAPASAVMVAVAPPDVTQEIRLRDGTTAVGRVVSVDADVVSFHTLGGAVLTFPITDVVALAVVQGRPDGTQFWKDDPNPTRLFFGPTGRPLKRGDVYLGVYEVLLPFVQVGLTDRLSVGGGTPLLFGTGGGAGRTFWFTPKFTVVNRQKTQAAIGVMHLTNIDDDDSLGIAYGAVTHGSRDSAITVGVGVAYERFEDISAPVVMLGAERRLHRNIKLITENYLFAEGGIASVGVRFLTGRLSADLGLASPLGVDDVFLFPMVNFVWSFR